MDDPTPRPGPPEGASPRRVAVVGAGLGGLSAAHAIRRHAEERGEALELEVWEATDRPGGQLRTVSEDGFLIEWAANAFRSGVGPNADLVARLGLEGEQVHANPAANRRYVFHGGRLHLMPSGPISLLEFEPLSVEGRFRILAEPFLAQRVDHEETVFDYAARHIGPEAAEILLGTMVRGVYGGDAHQLSVDAAFPVMRQMERDHRSLVVAGIAGTRERMQERKTTWSFRDGMNVIIDALAADLGDAVRTSTPALGLAVDGIGGGYLLTGPDGVPERFDDVVLAVPPGAAAKLLSSVDGADAHEVARDVALAVAHELSGIPSGAIGMVALGFPAAAFRTPPDGFGFLVAPGEELDVLGVLVESNVFPHRAPDGTVLVRVIMGGVAGPPIDELADAEMERIALTAVDRAWGLVEGTDGAPLRAWVGRQDRGIPQYVVGHQARLDRIETRLRALPGIHLAGNAYRGIAVGKLVEDAEVVADAVWTSRRGTSAWA